MEKTMTKEYKFTSDSGHEVLIETEHNELYYFGLYVTCEFIGWNHTWVSPSHLVERSDYTLVAFSHKLKKICGVVIPQNIFLEMKEDYLKVTHDCGKYIMAKITDKDNNVIMTKVGRAVAVVSFRGDVSYRMPISMEDAIRVHACDKKIYYYNGVEEGCMECDCPMVKESERRHYYFTHFIPNDPYFSEIDGIDEEGEHVTRELSLEIIDLYEELSDQR